MSQPDAPETTRCPSGHHYEPDSLSELQREQVEPCPFCNPMSEEEETEWAILQTFNTLRGTA